MIPLPALETDIEGKVSLFVLEYFYTVVYSECYRSYCWECHEDQYNDAHHQFAHHILALF